MHMWMIELAKFIVGSWFDKWIMKLVSVNALCCFSFHFLLLVEIRFGFDIKGGKWTLKNVSLIQELQLFKVK